MLEIREREPKLAAEPQYSRRHDIGVSHYERHDSAILHTLDTAYFTHTITQPRRYLRHAAFAVITRRYACYFQNTMLPLTMISLRHCQPDITRHYADITSHDTFGCHYT